MSIQAFGTAVVGAVAIGLSVGVAPSEALTFDNSGIRFDTDTTVTFEFLGGAGGFTFEGWNDFGIVEDPINNPVTIFQGLTPAATGTTATFLFKANQLYSLFLNVNPPFSFPGLPYIAYSTNSLNPNGVQQASFNGSDIFSGITIGWEDLPVNVFPFPDFSDYVVKASATPATPIPTPALLPGLLGIGIAALKKRKNEESEQVSR